MARARKKTPAADQGPAAAPEAAAAPPATASAPQADAGAAADSGGAPAGGDQAPAAAYPDGEAARQLAASSDGAGLNLSATAIDMFCDLAGSDALPELAFVVEGQPLARRDEILVAAFNVSDLSEPDWNGLAGPTREAILAAFLEGVRAMGRACLAIRAIAAKATAGDEEITARSRDGRPFRRAGVLWTEKDQTAYVTPEQAEAIRNDPGLLVKAAG